MPDVFLSYNREDQAIARRFAEAFAAEGLEVWWDTTLRAGEAYDQVTEKALKSAKAVVVLWSRRSVESRWVRAEATLADRNKTLMPAMIEPCERPIMFELTQTAELSHWEGDVRDRAWQAFMGDLKRFVQAGPAASTEKPAVGSALGQAPARQTATKPDRMSICVLPFANMSADPEQEYFSDGISEDIITDLSKVSALSVIARNTAFTFKGKSVAIKDVARALEVTHVLEGSVRKAGARVRITAQLIDGKAGDHVWADRWDRDLDDIFTLQDEISRAIVTALKLKLLPEEKEAIEDRGTTNLEAYDKCLRARALTHQFGGENLGRAIELYREALRLEPEFFQAWSGMMTALINYSNFAPNRRSELLAERDDAIQRMIEVTAQGRSNLYARALQAILNHDFVEADRLLQRAPVIAASERNGVVYACDIGLKESVGRINDALEATREIVRHDPLSLLHSLILQQLLSIAGRPEEADAEYRRSADLAGDREILEFFHFLEMWGRAAPEEIEAQYRRALACRGSMLGHPVFTELAGALGDAPAARALIRAALEDRIARNDGTLTIHLSHLAGFFGDADAALAAMRRGYVEMNWRPMRGMWSPEFREARQDPRFKDIVRELGIYDYWRASGNWGDFAQPVGDDDFEFIW